MVGPPDIPTSVSADSASPREVAIQDAPAPVRRASVTDDVAERLISSIVGGRFEFGERLPPEADLAKYLDVGRQSVREAIRTLRVLGLVDVRQGDGTFVVESHAQFVTRAFGWALLRDTRSARDIVEVRIAIEGELARAAARVATDDQLRELERAVADMDVHVNDLDAYCAADVSFHLALARVADNTALESLLTAIQALLRDWVRSALERPGTLESAQRHHREILAAVKKHDAEAAQIAMRVHIEDMGSVLLARKSN
jgi:GntR family transcriptional regulator, transcriptional repressor for pyruvate dehydrogenase complex